MDLRLVLLLPGPHSKIGWRDPVISLLCRAHNSHVLCFCCCCNEALLAELPGVPYPDLVLSVVGHMLGDLLHMSVHVQLVVLC